MTTARASQTDAGGPLAAPVRPGDLVAEKYRVEETLGVGGMGVVVAARDEVLERRVAIKFLLPRLAGSDTAVQRFVREARAATRITSEHVVRLLEIDKLPTGTPFFVMEYLEGRDLRAILRDEGPLEASTAVDYALQALQAVAEGHLKGIVHRDLKPGNLFLTRRADGTPLIKVLDFGIAKRLEQDDQVELGSLTSSDDVRLGSPAYMPPEQLQDPRDVDSRSDIWALGATLYELVCGKPAFEGQSYVELVSNILSAPPKPLSAREPRRALPEGLEAVLRKCLEKQRSARYANAAELATALARFGSLDARMSLTRVTGLKSLPSAHAVSSAVISESGPTCTTTLAVAGAAPLDGPTEASVTSADPRRRSRGWMIVLGTAATIALTFALRGFGKSTPDATLPQAQEPARPSPPAERPVIPPAPAPEMSTAVSPETAPRAPSASATTVAELPNRANSDQIASARRPRGTAAPAVVTAGLPPPEGSVGPAAAAARLLEPSSPESSNSLDRSGRSERIERLIETRR